MQRILLKSVRFAGRSNRVLIREVNQETISSYEAHVAEYIEGTPQEVTGDVKRWIDATLQDLPLDANILEFGSAFGRDAAYIEEKGYRIQRTDATQGFVDYLREHGHEAGQLNAITDELTDNYDLVFADAVLLHFTAKEVEVVLGKVLRSLSEGGRFSFSLKQGEGEEWSEAKLGAPRYFRYWQESEVIDLLKDVGYSDVDITDGSFGRSNAKWLHIIAKK